MTAGPEAVPKAGDHPDPGLIAAHAERRLSGSEGARLDEHLASCATCHEVFAETLRFALDEEGSGGVVPRRFLSALPFAQRPAFRLAAVLAVAATVVLAFQQLWLRRSRPEAPNLVSELVTAMGTTRFVEPRVTGGFRHGRLVVLRSVDRAQGLDAHSPEVIAAVARIRQQAGNDTSPAALGALGVTYLVSGDAAAAVKALEAATPQDPGNPRLQSDLSAAYFVRATQLDEPADLPKALEAAERAIARPGAPVEAWFNRALALERLHLVDAARKAWNDYLERDSTSEWAGEARKRLEELPAAQQSTVEEDRARAAAAVQAGQAAIDALADASPSVLRDYFDKELLTAWAAARLSDDPRALVLRDRARQAGDALFRTTGDAMPRDAAIALASTSPGTSRDPPRAQALGYRALHEAQRLSDLLNPSAACPPSREAHRLLKSGGSPYEALARERVVVTCFYPTQHREAFAELARLRALGVRRSYVHLLGRVHWMEALFRQHRGDFSPGVDEYRLALERFRALRDADSEASVLVRLADALRTVGESPAAWRELIRGLALLDQVRNPTRRYSILGLAALACLDGQLPMASLQLETAALDVDRQHPQPARIASSLVSRSEVFLALGSLERARADLTEARAWIAQSEDGVWGPMFTSQADAMEGRILTSSDPERAVSSIERALAYRVETTPGLVPETRLLLARAQLARGMPDAAEKELTEGIHLLESQRELVGSAERRASFFEQAAALFDEMVVLQLDQRRDPQRALAYVERSRARQLVDSLGSVPGLGVPGPGASVAARLAPLGPEGLQHELPDGLALVYYLCLPSRVLTWVLTREDLQFFEKPLPLDDLRRRLAAYETALVRRAPVPVVREHAARLFDELVRPARQVLHAGGSLVVIPDGVLQSLPFAALWDRERGRHLVEDYLVGMAPSGTVFVRASTGATAAARAGAPRLLAVGNPRAGREQAKALPNLRGAEAEAVEIARLYADSEVLTGPAATKRAFLEGLRRSQVVHYAGHATGGDTPGTARLLLASEPETGTSGALYPQQIDVTLPRTRVVVLAGCRTAAGPLSRLEGAFSLARPFLAAGVPSVVASLWDVDDAVSRRFFVAFHTGLLAAGDPGLALQRAQTSFVRNPDPSLAHPASWAGFVSLGGFDSRAPGASGPLDKSL